jgi:D-alanyl-D-alanine carboxypeptidase
VALAFVSNGLNYQMNDIMIGVLSIYFGKEFEIPSFDEKTISLSTEQMKKYVGMYVSDQLPMDIEIFVEKNTLKGQASGQSAFPLTATNKRTLRFNPAGILMEFDSLKNDRYQRFTLNQSGGSFLFKRADK